MGIGISQLTLSLPNGTCDDFGIYVLSADDKKEQCVRCFWNKEYMEYSCRPDCNYYITFEGESAIIKLPYNVKDESKTLTCEFFDKLKASSAGCLCSLSEITEDTWRKEESVQNCKDSSALLIGFDQPAEKVALGLAIAFLLLITVIAVVLILRSEYRKMIKRCKEDCCGNRRMGGGQPQAIEMI